MQEITFKKDNPNLKRYPDGSPQNDFAAYFAIHRKDDQYWRYGENLTNFVWAKKQLRYKSVAH